VAASGGCLQNQALGRALRAGLSSAGLRLLEARRIPPNDGGVALGQVWIAQHHLQGNLL
jgi:hydrogenase maturation protein HypF